MIQFVAYAVPRLSFVRSALYRPTNLLPKRSLLDTVELQLSEWKQSAVTASVQVAVDDDSERRKHSLRTSGKG